MRYMVMETYDSYAVLLDEEGRFIKAANFHYTVGQTVTDIFPMAEDTAEKKPRILIQWKKLVAIAACFVFIALGIFRYTNTPYASVYIKINPSVRIDIDKNDMVQNVIGTNADGETLVADYNYSGKDLNTAVDELVDKAIDMGFLYDGGQITVTLDGRTRWVETNSRPLTDHINRHLKEKMTVTIQVGGETVNTGTQVTIPATDYGESDYADRENDTDYGENSDGVTDYDTDVDTNYDDTDYGPENDGVTDYTENNRTNYNDTDYGPANDGVTDYGTDENKSDYRDTPYTPPEHHQNNSDYHHDTESHSDYEKDEGSDYED